MRIVFMGTPDFAVPSLELLAERHEVALVVTRPDAVRGRGRKLVPSPVKSAAQRRDLPVLEATRLGEGELEQVSSASPDVICVAAYGAILPDEVLEVAPFGCVNVHASLLPHGRGAAPIQRSVLEGDKFAGVSIMRIVHDLDAGPYCRQASVEVGELSCEELMGRLAELGAHELVVALDDMVAGTVRWVEQDEDAATYAAKVSKSEMLLDPTDDASLNLRRVRASLDAAPARMLVGGRGVRVLEASVADAQVEPGAVLVRKGRVSVGCDDGCLELLRVKPDGKRAMEARAWASGLRGDGLTWSRV